MDLIFATNNKHKLEEARAKIKDSFNIISLSDIACFDDIPETADTLEANAKMKADYVYLKYGADVFADDTGLEVYALGGRPGVYSARYAGNEATFEDNMQKLLEEMKGLNDRRARFRTIIHLILKGKHYSFEGIVEGAIIVEKHGHVGFGYDPIFQANGYEKTFAELSLAVKNSISHRGRALEKLAQFLER